MTKRLCPNPIFSWHLLPVVLGITAICGMITTYTLAKRNCHVEKWFLPYISYTGTEQPESSIFGLILNIEGFLGVVVVIIAWRFMRHMGHKSHLNSAALISGILSCFGVVMVGNFQVSKNKVPHYIGAALAFIVGTIYSALSSILTHKLHRSVNHRPSCSMFVCVLRFTATSIMGLSILILMCLAVLRLEFNAAYEKDNPEAIKLDNYEFRFPNGSCVPIIQRVPTHKRYLDLAGSISEWLLTACLLFSLSLYAYEFKNFHNVKIILKRKGTELNFALIQSRQSASFQQSKKYTMSPNATLLHSHSDTTIVGHHTSDKSPSRTCSDQFLFEHNHLCKNNNNKPPEADIVTFKSDLTKSLPNISSSDVEEV